jgi:hypothetical protein
MRVRVTLQGPDFFSDWEISQAENRSNFQNPSRGFSCFHKKTLTGHTEGAAE